MLDHITIGVRNFERSTAFYDQALQALGVKRVFDVPKSASDGINVTGYGDETPWFWLAEERPTSGLLHVAFSARSRADVEAFYAAALKAGGTDNGAPGLRPHYHAHYFAAFVLDPDGHNIEAVYHGT